MRLFDIIPDNFFSVLSSKNKGIYLDALFVLRKAYKQQMLIKKEDLVSMLVQDLEDRLMDIEDEDDAPKEKNLSSMAYFLLRRLEDCGWIEREYAQNTFEEYVMVYDYSIKLLNTLYDIIDITPKEYNSYVYSTYSLLKTANEERNGYMYNALSKAYENTNELVDELKSLLNNIRRYHQALGGESEIQEILKGHFDEFNELIADRIYHPLKTFDSVPRFKAPILDIIREWMFDENILDSMIESAILRKVYKSSEEASESIISMMGSIVDTYEHIDSLLYEIDRKKAAYTRASVEKMQYLLNTDRSIKGKLIEILKYVSRDEIKAEAVMDAMEKSADIFPVKYIDEFSLFSREDQGRRVTSEPLKVDNSYDEDAFMNEMDDLKERVKNSFTHKRVMEFMKDQFGQKSEMSSGDFQLKGDDDFIMLILASLKHDDEGSFYSVEFENSYVMNGGYRLPQMIFRRKQLNVAGRIQ